MEDKNKVKNKISIKNLDKKKKELEKFNNDHNNKREEKKIKIIIYLVSFILILILFTFIFIKTKRSKEEKVRYGKEQEEFQNEVKSLVYMKEDKRARKYLSQIIKNIKNGKYDEEYFKLYQEYKDNFFPTLRDYEIYIKENFPKDPATKYKNFEVIGDLFVLFVDIVDTDDPSKSLRDMKFVFKEEDLNKYVYSFSIKTHKDKDKDKEYITPPNEITFPEQNRSNILEQNKEFNLLEKLKENEQEENAEENKQSNN